MYHIRPGQIKAARAILGWSQDDLAAASGLSVTTIRNIESGDMSPRSATTNDIRIAIENAGLEFIEPEGIRRRTDEVKVFQGPDSRDRFFDDMLQTIKEKGGDIIAIFTSQEIMARSCGIPAGNVEWLAPLNEIADVRCLLPEAPEAALLTSTFEFRAILKQHLGPISYFVYGDRHAVVLVEGRASCRFVVFESASLAQSYRNHFIALWEMAPPIFVQVKNPDRRVVA